MQTISVITVEGKVKVSVDGIQLTDLHSFSLDYVKGAPLLFSCVADVGEPENKSILH